MLAVLLSSSFLGSISHASTTYEEVSVLQSEYVYYSPYNRYYTIEFSTDNGNDHYFHGSYCTVTRHYNKGIKYDVPSYPFYWEILPRYFYWYENGALKWSTSSFSHYQTTHHINPPWGGRRTEDVTFYLPGNIHGSRTHATLECQYTPRLWYSVDYGRPNG